MFTTVAILLFIPSQLFWFWQVGRLGKKFIPNPKVRSALAAVGFGVYSVFVAFNFFSPRPFPEPDHLTLRAALLNAPFQWWMLASLLGFAAMTVFYILSRVGLTAHWAYRKTFSAHKPAGEQFFSPERRRFLNTAAVAVSATPFAACAYGLLYERTDVQITHQRIFLSRLPKAFDGFRIAQLSDIHIGPFMPVEQIHRCVAKVNALKPDLVALTGDFVTWEGSPQAAVVEALSPLKAPFGVFGSLGNHEIWANVEDSITRLFAERGVRILRYQNALIESGGERLNLIGVDYETQTHFGRSHHGEVRQYLARVPPLMVPGAVNILLSHNPNTFDRAAQLGIELSLAGHTHGGQVAMEYISPNLSPARLITPYVRGWFRKGGSQLYVNRGIGTIFSPVRVGSPPEITLYELKVG